MQRWFVTVNDYYKTAHVLCEENPRWRFWLSDIVLSLMGAVIKWYWLYVRLSNLWIVIARTKTMFWFDIDWNQARAYYAVHKDFWPGTIEWDGGPGEPPAGYMLKYKTIHTAEVEKIGG